MKGRIPWDRPRKGVYALEEWEIDPARSVLLIMDMQRGYVEPDRGAGPVLKESYPAIYDYFYKRVRRKALPGISRLREFFRAHRLEVFYTRYGFQLPEGADLARGSWRQALVRRHPRSCFQRDTQDYQIVEDLTPSPGELALDKNTFGAFNSTPLNQLLRNMDLETVVITGILTNVAVESTARGAADLGYNVILAGDGCAAYSEADHRRPLHATNGYVVKSVREIISQLAPLL